MKKWNWNSIYIFEGADAVVLRAAEGVGDRLEHAEAVLVAAPVWNEEHDVEVKHVDRDLLEHVHHLNLFESKEKWNFLFCL